MTNSIDKRDAPYISAIIVSFLFGLASSWQRWGNPLIDCGREMMQPFRLLRGEMLYSDVRHIYGPLSPYLNAALYRIFGVSLNALYIDGAVSAVIVLSLIYWLSRQLMSRAAATLATLSVMWMCAFKAAGNYFLPYSYSALHGCALGLITLTFVVRFVQAKDDKRKGFYLFIASLCAALTTLAKTEMGFAAGAAGGVAAVLVGLPSVSRAVRYSLLFVVPFLAIVVVIYAAFASVVGWNTLIVDSFLLVRGLPPELVYFNKTVSGFDRPLHSLTLILNALLRLIALAASIAALSYWLARRTEAKAANQNLAFASNINPVDAAQAGYIDFRQAWMLLAATILMLISLPLIKGSLPWDQGPYLMMPLLIILLVIAPLREYASAVINGKRVQGRTIVFLVVAVYAMASLIRMILRVRSGGAYGSFLLPASVVLFIYAWTITFPSLIWGERARSFAKRIVYTLLWLSVLTMTFVTAIRYQRKNIVPLVSARGTLIAEREHGRAFAEAMKYVERETVEGDALVVLPEGNSIAFMMNRRNPLREDILTPGFLDAAGERRAIRQIEAAQTRVILIANRTTKEFSAEAIGRDYLHTLFDWIEANYTPVETFGERPDANLQFGDKIFFIRAYKRNG